VVIGIIAVDFMPSLMIAFRERFCDKKSEINYFP
jgi:hypothetical protein